MVRSEFSVLFKEAFLDSILNVLLWIRFEKILMQISKISVGIFGDVFRAALGTLF